MAAVNVYHESRLPLRVMAASTMAAATPSYGRVPCVKWKLDFERLFVFFAFSLCNESAYRRFLHLSQSWLIAAVPNSRVMMETVEDLPSSVVNLRFHNITDHPSESPVYHFLECTFVVGIYATAACQRDNVEDAFWIVFERCIKRAVLIEDSLQLE